MAESLDPASAWQPFTPAGVARFGYATPARLIAICGVIALVCVITIVTFVNQSYVPVLEEAINALPEQAALRDGYLHWPGLAATKLAANKFLSIHANPSGEILPRESSDLQAELGTAGVSIRSAIGYSPLPYPRTTQVPLNKDEMLSLWGAWKPAGFAALALVTTLALVLSWSLLASLFFVPVMIIAYYSDRALTLAGAWRLAFAALMPGALLMCFGITLYSLGEISPLLLAVLAAAHLLVSVVYVIFSPLCLDPVPEVTPLDNPFGGEKDVPRKVNPFSEA